MLCPNKQRYIKPFLCLDLPLVCLDINGTIATETCRWKYLHISDVFRLTFLFLAVPIQKRKKTGHNNDPADDNDDTRSPCTGRSSNDQRTKISWSLSSRVTGTVPGGRSSDEVLMRQGAQIGLCSDQSFTSIDPAADVWAADDHRETAAETKSAACSHRPLAIFPPR